ncbi:MAG: glycosyltransferase [Oscillospiraceae bacterium]|nr:glycosyltransferase [Oscillospiraceae bacterium]
MKRILVVSAEPWSREKDRVNCLASRMPEVDFRFLSPVDMKGLFKETRFKRQFAKAVEASVLILVSPAAHAGRLQSSGKPVLPLPAGVDFEAFSSAAERNLPFPDDLFNVKNPIIGHTGSVDESVNLQTVAEAAEAHPEWAFVFAGPILTDTAVWKPFPNIHLLGEKPPGHLPAYVSRFDVCVNLAKSAAAPPEKLYEYLASGKPIVSTPHPAQVLDYTEAVYLAGTPGEFIACCKKAISERDAWKTRRRIEYGRAASWDARAADLERTIKELS